MELYDISPKTAEMVELLRTRGTISAFNRDRQNGKTTALLIFAKELVDKVPYGSREAVLVLAAPQMRMPVRYRELFPHAGPQPGFITDIKAAYGGYTKLTLLVDEPYLTLGSFEKSRDLNNIARSNRVRVHSVGRWI